VQWRQQTAAEKELDERVRTLLQNELGVEEAVELALLNNRRLQATLWELGVARGELAQAALPRNPVLGAEVRFPDSPFEISLMQSLLDLFQLSARRKLATAAFEATKLRVANEVLELAIDVRAAFYRLQGAEQILTMHETTLEAARASTGLALRLHEAGNISELDLENDQALLEQAKLDLSRTELETLAARERLNSLMGVWGEQTEWRIAQRLPDPPPAEPDLEKAESLAVSRRLDLSLARQEVEVAARALPLARAEAIGEFMAGVHREREPDGSSSTGPAVEIPLPIFNLGGAAKSRAEAMVQQAMHRYAATAVEVRSQVRVARSRVQAARNSVDYYKRVILPRRVRIVELSQQQYNFMLIGAFQLLAAKRNEIGARREYIEALEEYWIARAELDRAVGGSLPTAESSAPTSDREAVPAGPVSVQPLLPTAQGDRP
jgi:cobalt-zinc-cadmium efflux system outer membrane protein